MRWLVAVMIAAGATAAGACSHSPGGPAMAREDLPSSRARVPGEYLVTLAPRADAKAIADVYGRFGVKRIQSLGRNVFLLTLGEDPGPARMEELRRQDARIEAVQPNYVYRGSSRDRRPAVPAASSAQAMVSSLTSAPVIPVENELNGRPVATATAGGAVVKTDLPLDAVLKRLNLANTRRIRRDLCARAEKQEWFYEDFLSTLVAEEVAHRQQTRLQKL